MTDLREILTDIQILDTPNRIFYMILNMLGKKVSLENMPVTILEYGSDYKLERITDILDMAFAECETFPKYTRRQKVFLQVPIYENSLRFREFFELYNSYSEFQNRTYGLAVLDFKKWIVENVIAEEAIMQISDLISRNAGNCLFILSDVPQVMMEALLKKSTINCIATRTNINSANYVREYCKKMKISWSDEELGIVTELLDKSNHVFWEKIMNKLSNKCFLGEQINDRLIEDFYEKNEQERKIGFHV